MRAILANVVGLYERDRFDTAADRNRHVVVQNLLCGGGDGHHAGRALSVERHAGDGLRQPGAQRGLTGDVGAGGTLLQRGTDDDVVDFARSNPGAFYCFRDGMAGQRLSLGVVERAAVGTADGRTGGGHDDGAAHDGYSLEFKH